MIQRYDISNWDCDGGEMEPCDDGEWVKFDDAWDLAIRPFVDRDEERALYNVGSALSYEFISDTSQPETVVDMILADMRVKMLEDLFKTGGRGTTNQEENS